MTHMIKFLAGVSLVLLLIAGVSVAQIGQPGIGYPPFNGGVVGNTIQAPSSCGPASYGFTGVTDPGLSRSGSTVYVGLGCSSSLARTSYSSTQIVSSVPDGPTTSSHTQGANSFLINSVVYGASQGQSATFGADDVTVDNGQATGSEFKVVRAGIVGKGGGGSVTSGASITPTGNLFHVTGTGGPITSIDTTNTGIVTGFCMTMIFDSTPTVTDGSTLKLAGNFVATADDTLSLCYDGTNWFETARAVN